MVAGADLRLGTPARPPAVEGPERRLLDAMVEVAGRHGYGEATVARVVARAGASRATFYEHFAGKDACFLAAYRRESKSLQATLLAAGDGVPVAARPEARLEALLAALAAQPAVGRLVLVEALAAPAAVRVEHERFLSCFARLVASFLEDQRGAPPIQIPALALVSGVVEAVSLRVLKGDGGLADLREGLSRWIDSYRLPAGTMPVPQRRWRELGRFARHVKAPDRAAPSLLPRGRSGLSPKDVATARRQRLLDATARIAAEGDYFALTVANIARTARVPRAAFYSHFTGKQEAFLAAQTAAMQGAMGAAASEYCPDAPWPERIWRAGEAFLEQVGTNPDYARLDFLEAHAAGMDAVLLRHRNQMSFALFLEDGYRQRPQGRELPEITSETIPSAIFGLMRGLVLEGRTERMLSLLPAAVYTATAPFIGPREALAWVQHRSRVAR